MSDYITKRFFILFEVLKTCSTQQDKGKQPIFDEWERIFINQERSKLLQGLENYKQDPQLEQKIQDTITNKF